MSQAVLQSEDEHERCPRNPTLPLGLASESAPTHSAKSGATLGDDRRLRRGGVAPGASKSQPPRSRGPRSRSIEVGPVPSAEPPAVAGRQASGTALREVQVTGVIDTQAHEIEDHLRGLGYLRARSGRPDHIRGDILGACRVLKAGPSQRVRVPPGEESEPPVAGHRPGSRGVRSKRGVKSPFGGSKSAGRNIK